MDKITIQFCRYPSGEKAFYTEDGVNPFCFARYEDAKQTAKILEWCEHTDVQIIVS